MAVDVVHDERSFTGLRGLAIHVRSWRPEAEPGEAVVIAHGFAEHSGRYDALARRLVAAGFGATALDHRGHGRSQGARTSIERFSDYVADLATLVDAERARCGAAPFLLGHSLGGLIALAYAIERPETLRGLVLSAPAACPGDVSSVRIAVGRLLSRIAPRTPVLRPPLQRISRDPAVVTAYNEDPLVFRSAIRARLGAEMLATMQRVDEALPGLPTPLLVLQGAADGIVDPDCAQRVYERAGSADRTLRTYPGLWHEIFNEPERDQVIADLIAWLMAHRDTQGAGHGARC